MFSNSRIHWVIFLFFATTISAALDANAPYDYIVVGSGPGGAPVAAKLAQSGYSVLLVDAGDDQRSNTNTTVAIALANAAAEDDALRWDFFNPPAGSERLGVYYPRSGTLGGCSAHNAGAAVLPQDSYWDHISEMTGDETWNPRSMRGYFEEFERNMYSPKGTLGHGFDGWLTTSTTPPEAALANRSGRLAITREIAAKMGHDEDVYERMSVDINSNDPARDRQQGLFNFPFHHTPGGRRTNANLLLDSVLAARNEDGTPVNLLTIQLETLVTRVLFDDSGDTPRAIGVEYMQGKSLHRVLAKKGIIVSGGVFNTPQILKLSGIGPADELAKFGIPVVVHLPGVGAHLQDNYEISLAAHASVNLSAPADPNAPQCTHGIGDDPCVGLWRQGRGPYAIPGASHLVYKRSSVAQDNERDVVFWNPPSVLRGFFPGFSRPQGDPPTTFSFAMLHAQGRNHGGGSVGLRSADPRDVPDIFFNFWAEGAEQDLQALYEGIEFGRDVLSSMAEPVGPFTEFQPCLGRVGANCTAQATKDFIRRQVYSHHASSTAAIGADGDPLAVLDSRFRVRGTRGLHVVDGSALPRPPSPFPIIGQFMASYKAAEVILEDARGNGD
ncbi:GMC oxidoreductase domain-containing protein [Hirsutella rhossiliensis]|uniref:GMC oxidoreductase domain-containing protein n=1 Tax=Hirsutella rhossiliensis TaxID=111463 RepID=A0A9P8MS43_9HYPO|nr:GMC oxidoreductase domain-containing protein [Hirsutella rhossiliensis]KAH0960195.1 GMC oxidoreductase domain-containing protein [Hirsutella rhossiliensis]